MRTLLISIRTTLVLAVLLCGFYPLAVWVVGQVAFADKANGTLAKVGNTVVGSKLIGQAFSKPEYFQGRPSAAGANGYDAASSSGSNFGPTNQKLIDRISGDVTRTLAINPGLAKGQIPVDFITASGSGLDPHISPDSAKLQIERVARARNLSTEEVREVVAEFTAGPQLGFLGEATVNVLAVNLALDKLKDAARK